MKVANLEIAWFAHISSERWQRKLEKCHFFPLKNFPEFTYNKYLLSTNKQTMAKQYYRVLLAREIP